MPAKITAVVKPGRRMVFSASASYQSNIRLKLFVESAFEARKKLRFASSVRPSSCVGLDELGAIEGHYGHGNEV